MIQSLDGSSRDIINSIDSANKITAKQFMNQHYQDTEARIKINKQPNISLDETLNQPNQEALGKQVNIITSLADNVLQEKSKFQIFLESIFQALGNFTVVYYIVLFLGGYYFKINGFYNQLYYGITLVVCFLISFYDILINKLQLYYSIEKSDIQKIQTYIQDEFQECSQGELQPGNVIKIIPKQKCPVDGIILGTAGVTENVPLLDIGGQTVTRRAGISSLILSKQLEGNIEFDNEEKKFRVTLKMENNQLSLDLQQQNKIRIHQTNNSYDDIYIIVTNQTLRQQKLQQSSAYEKTKINPKLAFSLHMQNILIIIFTFLISAILMTLHFIQTKYPYLNNKQEEGYLKTYFQFLTILSWGIPIFQFPYIYIVNRISLFQAENDKLLDVDISGKKIQIINSSVLSNMARAKYILTDLQLLTRKTKAVSNLFLNKSSEEINLNDLVTLTPIEDIDDINFCQQEAKYALLAFESTSKNEDDIAIQKKLLSHGLIVGIKQKQRIIQDMQQNQTYFNKKFELISSKYKLFGYEQILKDNLKQYLIVFRQKYIDCKEDLSSEIQIQIAQLVDNKDNINDIVIVFKKLVSMQYLDRITKIIDETKNIDTETLKQIKLDVEPIVFVEIEDEFYDCSQEIMDIQRCEYKIWINCHIKEMQTLEHDPTIASLFEQTKVQQISCQNGDELQVALDQLEKNFQIKVVGKQQSYYSNNLPLLLVIDNVSLSIGLNNQLLNDKFKQAFLKVPYVLLLNSKPHLNYSLSQIIQSHELICATNYITQTPSMHICLDNNNDKSCDIRLPNFSFLPKVLIVHGRLNNIRQQQSINFQNYVACILFVFQFSYTCYNRFSQRQLLNEFIYFIAMLFTQIYGFLFFSMAQDFNFEILKNQPVYHLMVRTPKNPYKLLLTQFCQGLLQGSFVVFSTIWTFYGSNDQNGYVHGCQLHQFISLSILFSVIAFKPIVDQYKIVKSQIYLAFLYLFVSIYIIQKNNGNMSELFTTGIKTKDLCAIVFFPICALSPNLIAKFAQRLLSTNNLNYCLYKMEVKHDEEVENQKLRDAKNYIKLYQKEEDEPQQEDIVNSKKVL